jgi:hypothetical protein
MAGSLVFMGVDPGFTGAIAFLEDIDGAECATVYDMPVRMQGAKKRVDRDRLARIFMQECTGNRLAAVVEKVAPIGGKRNKAGGVRKEGTVSQFRFGQGQGEVLGLLSMYTAMHGGVVFEIAPQTWKAKCGLVKVDERALCRRVGKLFRGQELFGPQGRALHGRAEALFLAAYARFLIERKGIYDR